MRGWADVKVMAARIIDVDPLRWTCTVKTEVGMKTIYNVDIGSDYLHVFDGEGIHVMPEIGAAVWVAQSSEGDYPCFIMRYRGYPSQSVRGDSNQSLPDLKSNRPRMSPGDIVMQTRDRNGVRMRRGRITEILGSPLARTIYNGAAGVVHTLAKATKLDTLGGSVRWLVARAATDSRGRQTTTLEAEFKKYADDSDPVVRLRAGGGLSTPAAGAPDGSRSVYGPAPDSAEVVNTPVIQLQVLSGGRPVSALAADESGQIELTGTAEISIQLRGALNATLKMTPTGELSLEADTAVSVTAPLLEVAVSQLSVAAGSLGISGDGDTLQIGDVAPSPVLLDKGFSDSLAAALQEIVLIASLSNVPVPGVLALIAQLEASVFTSTKVSSD